MHINLVNRGCLAPLQNDHAHIWHYIVMRRARMSVVLSGIVLHPSRVAQSVWPVLGPDVTCVH